MNKQELKAAWGQYVDTDKLVDDVRNLLTKYHHDNTETGVCTVLNEYFTNKEPLIKMIVNSSHYTGNLRIVLTKEFDRCTNVDDVKRFCDYFLSNLEAQDSLIKSVDDSGKSFTDHLKIGVSRMHVSDLRNDDIIARLNANATSLDQFDSYGRFIPSIHRYQQLSNAISKFRGITSGTVSSDLCSILNETVPEVKCAQGMKTSRAFNRICDFFGLTQLPKYNKLFAEYSDMVSDLKRTLDYVISVNPHDYLTMSFGKNWASCHTIDTRNERNMPSSYHGAYCAGTLSYLMDRSSIITYVVDHNADVQTCGKIYRNMFHYENNVLIQARIYPQGNDGATDLYFTFRTYMQEEMTEMLGLESNSWVVRKGTTECEDHTTSTGNHYRDYRNFPDCNVCYPKERAQSIGRVSIGHDGICVKCGREMDYSDRLNHRSC